MRLPLFSLFKVSALSWMKHKDARLGAALAYYSIFSLGPIVMIVMARRAQSAAGFWLATAAGLTAFFLLSSQAMPNYWYLIAALTIAGALSPFGRD